MTEIRGRNTGDAPRRPPKREAPVAEPPDDSRNLGSRAGKHGARMAGTSCRNMDGSPAPMFPETGDSRG